VTEHQEPDRLHAEIAGGPEMLHGHVGLGAVRRYPGDRRAHFAGVPQVLDGAEAGQQQHGDPGLPRFADGGGDEVELIDAGEPVIEAGPAETVAMADLDDRHVAAVQGMHDGAYLLLGELVRHGMGAIAQRGVS